MGEPVVTEPLPAFSCDGCDDTGNLLIMEGDRPLCLVCADLCRA